jgi:hypothetical protein
MALIDEVFVVCQRLAPYWNSYLQGHDLSIDGQTPKLLEDQLSAELDVDTSIEGFEDFALLSGPNVTKAIEPGSPARSLLYHALASPNVRPSSIPEKAYPQPEELEVIENYIYASQNLTQDDLQMKAGTSALAIAVFTKEYRPAPETAHRRHADLCFSRVGIARMGTEPSHYDPRGRCFQTFIDRSGPYVRVLPCRYSAYIAVRMKGDASLGRPFRFQPGDNAQDFWIPIHKIFNGKECILGLDLQITFENFQTNEKLRKLHLALQALGFDSLHHENAISRPPLTTTSDSFKPGNTFVVMPQAGALTERLKNAKGLPIVFRVPPNPISENSSFHLMPRPLRSAPEFTHIRDQKRLGRIIDMNKQPDVLELTRSGGYDALHYSDPSSEGFVRVICAELDTLIPRRFAAYSIVAPPDLLPLVKQAAAMEWWENSVPEDVKNNIWDGKPVPLCDTRCAGNVEIERARFDPLDTTLPSIVSADPVLPAGATRQVASYASPVSSLPDDAAGVFAPGWDVSKDSTPGSFDPQVGVIAPVEHLAGYGLGSPFLEDTKLCAAQSAFWPAAAPDTTRQYGPIGQPSATPLTDSELGWDNVGPPDLVRSNVARFSAIDYADYVHTALAGRFDFRAVGRIDFDEYRARTLTMARVHQALKARDFSTRGKWSVFRFRDVARKELTAIKRDNPNFQPGRSCYYFEMFQPTGVWRGSGPDFNKIYASFYEMIKIVANQQVVWKYRNGKWTQLLF